jgi:hypothetical protein
MAKDLFFKNSKRDWSRSNGDDSATSGYDPYGRSLFERHPRDVPTTIIVKQEPARMGWFGFTMAAMVSTRILSGKWPWYWAGVASKKLESPRSPRKG